ncbi:uncharacterized protein LOC116990025 [Amblyraja radiata]|uniref:uncharacterized protein LOC116990025 n=1 Tax=Amblyraja radiata TaxID=386614 RepID=UPI001401CFAC|nr:uncharacterized protein LOC116990025 [Amblyraja radiata]
MAPLQEELKDLERRGIITPVERSTDWISSMVAVRKPNGKLRICIDPKPLNRALKRSHYPIPTIDDILPEMSKAKVFTVCDVKQGFWHVKLEEEPSFLTTFATPFGRFRWLRMPMGISPAPEVFQRKLMQALEGLPGVCVIADDVLITGEGATQEEAGKDHDEKVRRFLTRCRERNIKLNADKFKLRQKEVPYIASGSSVSVIVRDREVNGTVGRSALLASCYSTPDLCSQLTLQWRLHDSTTPLVRLSRSDCSPHTDRPGCNCSVRWKTSPSHTGRVHLYPENGSLLLRDLRRTDSGVYEISVYSGGNNSVKDNVTLTVYNHHTETESVTSTSVTATGSGRNRLMDTVIPASLFLILITIVLTILLTKGLRDYYRRRKSDATEGFVAFNRVSRQDLNKAPELNSRDDIIYCLLQLPKANRPATPDNQDAGIIYAVPQRVQWR